MSRRFSCARIMSSARGVAATMGPRSALAMVECDARWREIDPGVWPRWGGGTPLALRVALTPRFASVRLLTGVWRGVLLLPLFGDTRPWDGRRGLRGENRWLPANSSGGGWGCSNGSATRSLAGVAGPASGACWVRNASTAVRLASSPLPLGVLATDGRRRNDALRRRPVGSDAGPRSAPTCAPPAASCVTSSSDGGAFFTRACFLRATARAILLAVRLERLGVLPMSVAASPTPTTLRTLLLSADSVSSSTAPPPPPPAPPLSSELSSLPSASAAVCTSDRYALTTSRLLL